MPIGVPQHYQFSIVVPIYMIKIGRIPLTKLSLNQEKSGSFVHLKIFRQEPRESARPCTTTTKKRCRRTSKRRGIYCCQMRVRWYLYLGIYGKVTGVFTEVTVGVDALNGPEPWSARISVEIQYSSKSSAHNISSFLTSPGSQRSTTLFSHEAFWSMALQRCGKRDARIRTQTVRHTESELRVHA